MTRFSTWETEATGGISKRSYTDRAMDAVKVNEFYPPTEDESTLHDGASHPLSGFYSTLADAQVDYPFADSLDNEVDWCAWMAALLHIYTNQKTEGTYNGATLYADGIYYVNKTITCNVASIRIIGNSHTNANGGEATQVRYSTTGTSGSQDAPVYIFDFYTIDETGAYGTQPGSSTASTATAGPVVAIDNIAIFGQFASMLTNSVSLSNYISGIRVRYGQWFSAASCTFGGSLWDGVVFTGARLFDVIERCNFVAVHRDAISFTAVSGNFSTTMWIRYNEFNFVGRYAILLDLNGSIEAAPRIVGNSFEHSFAQSYFVLHPEWFVQGLVSGVCLINCGNVNCRDNRYESVASTTGYLASLHLVACQSPSIRDDDTQHIAMTAFAATARTSAYTTFLSSNLYGDITDQRNYHCGSSGDFSTVCDSPVLSNIYNLNKLIVADSTGITGEGLITVDNCNFLIKSYPTQAGTYATLIDPGGSVTNISASAYRISGMSCQLPQSTSTNSVAGAAVQQQVFDGRWGTTLAARKNPIDSTNEIMLFNEFFMRSGNNLNVDGSSSAKWDGFKGFTLNRSLTDLTLATSNYVDYPFLYANIYDKDGNFVRYLEIAGAVVTTRKVRYDFSAAPASGTWAVGDIVYNNAPASAGFIGWVCTVAGSPGTWKTFGLIS